MVILLHSDPSIWEELATVAAGAVCLWISFRAEQIAQGRRRILQRLGLSCEQLDRYWVPLGLDILIFRVGGVLAAVFFLVTAFLAARG